MEKTRTRAEVSAILKSEHLPTVTLIAPSTLVLTKLMRPISVHANVDFSKRKDLERVGIVPNSNPGGASKCWRKKTRLISAKAVMAATC